MTRREWLHDAWKAVPFILDLLWVLPIDFCNLLVWGLPTNFVIMEIEGDSQILIILGRTFIGTFGVILNLK